MCPTILGRIETRTFDPHRPRDPRDDPLAASPATRASSSSSGSTCCRASSLDVFFYPYVIKWQPPWLTFVLARRRVRHHLHARPGPRRRPQADRRGVVVLAGVDAGHLDQGRHPPDRLAELDRERRRVPPDGLVGAARGRADAAAGRRAVGRTGRDPRSCASSRRSTRSPPSCATVPSPTGVHRADGSTAAARGRARLHAPGRRRAPPPPARARRGAVHARTPTTSSRWRRSRARRASPRRCSTTTSRASRRSSRPTLEPAAASSPSACDARPDLPPARGS